MKTSLPETPTADDFRALARSSPWRFRTLHWTHSSAGADSENRPVEAWLRRPSSPADPPRPTLGPDGLVAMRPQDHHLTDGDPMWQTYLWTAMLDPEELSHDVDLTDVYATERFGRLTWWATAIATPDYDPRCSCCALIYDHVSISLVSQFFAEIDDRRMRGREVSSDDLPTAHLVGLDVQTGIVVDITPLDDRCVPSVSNEIHAVDEDLQPPLP